MVHQEIKDRPVIRRGGYPGFVFFLLILSLTILAAGGCRSQKIKGLVPGEGVVLYEGIPLAWASLSFIPVDKTKAGSRTAAAMTDARGNFSVRTLGQKGILPGEYVVTVEKFIPNEGDDPVSDWVTRRNEPGYLEPEPIETLDVVTAIPLYYSYANESELSVVIEEKKGNKSIRFALKEE